MSNRQVCEGGTTSKAAPKSPGSFSWDSSTIANEGRPGDPSQILLTAIVKTKL